MNFLLFSPDPLSLDMALTRCLPAGNPVKVLHPEESLTACNALVRGARKMEEMFNLCIALSLT